jgi:spoIIIJ-associated protein
MDSVEANGKTVEEAIELVLKQLDAKREEVEIEVLSQGKSGLFGIGGEPARVRGTALAEGGGLVQAAKVIVDNFLTTMGVDAVSTISKPPDDSPDTQLIEITGDDSGLLIGRRGETLRSMQFMMNLLLSRNPDQAEGRIILDVEQYRHRRTQVLKGLALRIANRVAGTGRSFTLEPMNPAERRAIHIALADHPKVTTQSLGDGEDRKVTIMPRNGDNAARGQSPRSNPRQSSEQPAEQSQQNSNDEQDED